MNGRRTWWSRARLSAALVGVVLGCASGGGKTDAPNETPPACPAEEPEEGSACATIGSSCHYRGLHTSSLCTGSGTWQSRVFAAEPDAPTLRESLAGYVDCASEASCAEPLCMAQCCQPGASGNPQGAAAGCVFCCANKPCSSFGPQDCPRTQCALVTDCFAMPVCVELGRTEPGCALVGDSPSQVDCCQGLVSRCGKLASFGDCDAERDADPFSERPVCLACGDGTCEAYVENKCNCPEDCL